MSDWNTWAGHLLNFAGSNADACAVFCPDSGSIWGKAGSAEIDERNLIAKDKVSDGKKWHFVRDVPLTSGEYAKVFKLDSSSLVIAPRVSLRGMPVGMAVHFEKERPEKGVDAIEKTSKL